MKEVIYNNFKWIITLFILLYNTNISFSYIDHHPDPISIFITPDSTNGIINDGTITCKIKNDSHDTLVIINEFYIEGLDAGDIEIIPMSSFYSPNMICVSSHKYPKIEGDGYFRINYYEFPLFLLIKPKSSKVLKLKIGQYANLFLSEYWNLAPYFRLAYKEDLDKIIKKFYNTRSMEYAHSLIYSDTVYTNAILKDSIKYLDKYVDETGKESVDLIKDAFKIIK